jgi:hypothetical protein
MAKILVAGGLYAEDEDKQLRDARQQFVVQIGEEIIARNHVLLGGCRTSLDAEVASAAAKKASSLNKDPRQVIKSWVTGSTKPSHNKGKILRSSVSDWSKVPKGFAFPEPIQEADVVIIIGGWDGTHYAATWARLANKPLVPVASFGLAAAEIFQDEVANFERRYGTRLTLDNYQTLNLLLTDYSTETVKGFARDVVALAELLIISTDVFVIMSFSEKGFLKDAYNTFVRVCKEEPFGLRAFKVDQHLDANQRIIPNIFNAIRQSAFIIADLSEPRPNVYYELGYAQALGKDVITTAAEGTQLPFDIFDVPVQYWDCQDTLETKLRTQISHIRGKYGKSGTSMGR